MKFDFYGGYSIPLAELKGDFPDTLGLTLLDFTKSPTLLTKKGYNFGVTGKYVIDTSGKGSFTAGFSYNSFSGSKNYTTATQNIDYQNKVNIFSIFAGVNQRHNQIVVFYELLEDSITDVIFEKYKLIFKPQFMNYFLYSNAIAV